MNSLHEVGEEALAERIPCRKGTGWPLGKMISVAVVVRVVAWFAIAAVIVAVLVKLFLLALLRQVSLCT